MMTIFKQITYLSMQLAIVAGLFLFATLGSSYAAGCGAKARSIAAQQGGKVLSAKAKGKTCRIKILIAQPKGPPKAKTIIVRK